MTTTHHDPHARPTAGPTARRSDRPLDGATDGRATGPSRPSGTPGGLGPVRPARAAACILTAAAPRPAERPRFDRQRLVQLMAAMADGDPSATFDLSREFSGPLAAVVRVELRRRNIHRIDDDELGGLVLDVCLVLAEVAGAWDPSGAMPWHWARHRVRAVVDGWLGQFADRWEPERHAEHVAADPPRPWAGGEPSMLEVLGGLAGQHPAIALLAEALAEIGSPRDQELLLGYVVQQQAGDPSPSVTLGVLTGRSPDAVRQAVARIRRRLRELVATNPRYAVLDGLPLVA